MTSDEGAQALHVARVMGAQLVVVVAAEQHPDGTMEIRTGFAARINIPAAHVAEIVRRAAREIAADKPARTEQHQLDEGDL